MSKLRLDVERLGPLAGALIGLAVFFVVANARILDPTNIAWLQGGDPASHYLTWATYRHGPWTLPPGYNPAYGLELATSILFNDAIPLVALTLKPFSPVLSEPFQYFGIWLLACFVLQGFFAWKIGEALGLPLIARAALAGLLVLAPPLLARLHGHYALFAQWLILAALYLYLRPAPKTLAYAWPALLAISSVVQPYIFGMVGAIWAADLVKRRWLGEVTWRNWLCEIGLAIGVVTISLWLAGFFAIARGRVTGFGGYRFDLLAPLDPKGWSRLLADFPYNFGGGEGFSYLGLGVLVLIVLIVPALFRGLAAPLLTRRLLPLLIALLALMLYALTDHVSVAGEHVATVPLPDWSAALTGTFRTAARMVWPIYYAIIIGVVWLTVTAYGAKAGSVLVAAAFLIQAVDTSAGWPRFQSRLVAFGPTWSTPLKSPFWDKAAQRYKKVRSLPVKKTALRWEPIGYYALTHGLETDTVYFSRIDRNAVRRLQSSGLDMAPTASPASDTFYILETPLAATLPTPSPDDLLAKIDGLWVYAPGGAALGQEPGVDQQTPRGDESLMLPSEPISFGSQGVGKRYLGSGWSHVEGPGVWSDGPLAWLAFCTRHKPERDLRFVFQAQGFPPHRHGKQPVTVSVGSRTLADFDLGSKKREIEVVVPAELVDQAGQNGCFQLSFHIGNPKNSREYRQRGDSRELGIRLVSLKVYDE